MIFENKTLKFVLSHFENNRCVPIHRIKRKCLKHTLIVHTLMVGCDFGKFQKI